VVEVVERLCIEAAYELADDVLSALKAAVERESSASAREILEALVKNAYLAKTERIPLCQDTGVAVVFVEQGCRMGVTAPQCRPDATIIDAINEAVAAGYEKGFLRKSIVAEPLNQRINTGTNTPVIVHYNVVAGDRLRLTMLAKGGGSENKSRFRMFRPTAEAQEIIGWVVDVVGQAGADACPPFVVGVGIGGDFELSCLLSKKALCRELGSRNPDRFYAQLEADILSGINLLGIGPAGLGGDTTALAVMVETAGCHIASLPVAVNIECHSHRRSSVVI